MSFDLTIMVFCIALIVTIDAGCDYDHEEDEFNNASVKKSKFCYNFNHLIASDKTRYKTFKCYDDVVSEIVNRTSSISSRVSGDTETPCLSTNKTITPRELKNTNKQKRQIVNSFALVQAITYNKCSCINEPCADGVFTAAGFAYVCRQQYVLMTLKVQEANGDIGEDDFPIRSACICVLVKEKKK